jgi:hypothetical protein
MSKISKKYLDKGRCNQIPPAGMRPDRLTEYGIPVPDDESITDAVQFRQFHQT